jgi:PAS domain S-box-containing protein
MDQTPEEYFAQLHPEDVQRVVWAYRQAFDPVRRPVYDVEYRIIAKDGVTRWIAARGRGVFDAEGTCIRVIGTAIDITRQKETAEALRQSEEQLRLATEFADVGLWDIDVVSDQLYWPRRVNAMFGLPPDAPISPKQFRALIHPEDRRRVVGAALASCDPQQRTPYDIEYRIVRANDAAVRWMTARGKAVFENERCTRMLGIIVDITARKEIEQQLQELNETLEKRVAERTAALEKSEAQIRQAEQALQQAQKMEAIGNLTGGIAHDFNNLLQGVAGSLDLIRRNPADLDRVRRWAEAGLQAAGRGAKLTAQLLAFSRSQKLELRPVELAPLVMGMEDLLGRTLGPAIRLSFDLDSKAAAVLGDETQIELAVLNLAINARDAMPSGGELKIAMRRTRDAADAQLASGEYVELSVTDSGTGMPPEIVERAFDPFFTTKGVGKGTGLGLSQVYAMARQAGGIARIRSSPGRGATVSIFLPVTHAAPQAIAALAEQADAHPAAATILVIDDDRDVRRFLADSLDSFGYAVLQAEDGPAGLDALARHAPDLAIIDYAMPGMTGAEVAQQIRMNKPGMPIIFASGYAETSALDGVTENATVLRKPFRVSELQNAVRTALGQ